MSEWPITLHERYVRHKGKLTDEEVRFIRVSDLSLAELGRMFSVHYTTISNIKEGLTYKHVSAAPSPTIQEQSKHE